MYFPGRRVQRKRAEEKIWLVIVRIVEEHLFRSLLVIFSPPGH